MGEPITVSEAVQRIIDALKRAEISAHEAFSSFDKIANEQKEAKMAEKKTYRLIWAAPQGGEYGIWSKLHNFLQKKIKEVVIAATTHETYLNGESDDGTSTALYLQYAQFTAEDDEQANKTRSRILQAMLEYQQDESEVVFFLEGPAGVLQDLTGDRPFRRVPPGLIVLEIE